VAADAPFDQVVNSMIIEAFKMRASDIHLEPMAEELPVALPHRRYAPRDEVASKPCSPHHQRSRFSPNMSISEHRIPPGRLQTTLAES